MSTQETHESDDDDDPVAHQTREDNAVAAEPRGGLGSRLKTPCVWQRT
jgi:hypothetical protein